MKTAGTKNAGPLGAGTTGTARVGERGDSGGDTFSFCGKSIDFAELELRTLGNTIHLTVMEAEFLRYLVRSEGRVVSRKSILEDVWGLREDTDTRAIDNFVVRLRRYIEEDPSQPETSADGAGSGVSVCGGAGVGDGTPLIIVEISP